MNVYTSDARSVAGIPLPSVGDVSAERCGHWVLNGTHFPGGVNAELCRALEYLRLARIRVRVEYDFRRGRRPGDPVLVDDMEYGYVGRSSGPCKVPLLIHSRASSGGPMFSVGNVIRVRTSSKRAKRYPGEVKVNGYVVYWEHPDYVREGDVLQSYVNGEWIG